MGEILLGEPYLPIGTSSFEEKVGFNRATGSRNYMREPHVVKLCIRVIIELISSCR